MASVIKTEITKVYADTSVFGGVFDEEFDVSSKAFFDAVKRGTFKLITSELVRQEILAGPKKVINLFDDFLAFAQIAEVSDSVIQLQQAYIKAGIVSEKYSADAMHVALATV